MGEVKKDVGGDWVWGKSRKVRSSTKSRCAAPLLR